MDSAGFEETGSHGRIFSDLPYPDLRIRMSCRQGWNGLERVLHRSAVRQGAQQAESSGREMEGVLPGGDHQASAAGLLEAYAAHQGGKSPAYEYHIEFHIFPFNPNTSE
jgi:hypothetical protein